MTPFSPKSISHISDNLNAQAPMVVQSPCNIIMYSCYIIYYVLCNNNREARLRSGASTAVHQGRTLIALLLLARFSVLSWPHTNETIGNV